MVLKDSYIHNGDDCIAVKSGKQPAAWTCDIPSENILVQNVTCAGSHGLTIGSEVTGGIRNVTFFNVRIHGVDGHPSSGAIKFKLPCGRGAYVKDVLYENVTTSDVASRIMLAGAGASCSINGSCQQRDHQEYACSEDRWAGFCDRWLMCGGSSCQLYYIQREA